MSEEEHTTPALQQACSMIEEARALSIEALEIIKRLNIESVRKPEVRVSEDNKDAVQELEQLLGGIFDPTAFAALSGAQHARFRRAIAYAVDRIECSGYILVEHGPDSEEPDGGHYFAWPPDLS